MSNVTGEPAVRRVKVVVLGLGGVGRALVQQVVEARPRHLSQHGTVFVVVALADSSGVLYAGSGRGHELSDDELVTAIGFKKAGQRLGEVPHGAPLPADGPAGLVRELGGCALVVDCTSSETTAEALAVALESGGAAVTANKKPVTASAAMFARLLDPGRRARFGFESSVGAGTPMVASALRLVSGGDRVRAVKGCFSGTLGYLCSGLQAGEAYSEVVRRAHSLGYTEPDPRDDLGGTDVARKALILARVFGARAELSDVEVEPLFPAELAGVPVPDFLAALPGLDAAYAERAAAAAAAGAALRYVASVELSSGGRAAIKVGLAQVPLDSPLGGLNGTANMVEFHTAIYGDEPLVVKGSGAGVEITASGVIADMVSCAAAL